MVVFSLVKLVCTNVTMGGVVLTVTVLVLLSLSQYVLIWRLRHDRETHLYAYPTTLHPNDTAASLTRPTSRPRQLRIRIRIPQHSNSCALRVSIAAQLRMPWPVLLASSKGSRCQIASMSEY